jgi:hypothetical protein
MLLAESWDVGPNLVTIVLAIVGLGTLYVQNRRNNKVAVEANKVAVEATKELKPNGGSSVRDAIDRIERQTLMTAIKVDALAERVGVVEHKIDEIPPQPPAT